jgi:hypothetical protein
MAGAATTTALLAMFPSPDHNEIGIGPYSHDVADQALPVEQLFVPGEGIELMGRRVFDTTQDGITGTGENLRLRLYRDSEGVVQLDSLSYDSLLFSVRSRPELGDQFDLGLLFGSWEEVWAWDTGRSQYRLFAPVTLTLLGFSNTDQDEDSRMKHYISAGGGFGGEVMTRVVGPVGLQARAEGKARTTNRHRGGDINLTRHEVRGAAELGLSWLRDRQAWVLGGWVEHISQWENRDEDGASGVDRQYLGAGVRLSARFYKGTPVTDIEQEMVDLDMLLDALQTREEVLQARESAIAEETSGEAEVLVPEVAPHAEADEGEATLVHWSELAFVRRVEPIYPKGALGEGRCTVRLFVDDEGQPSDVKAEDCPEPWLRPTMQAVWQWKFTPVEEEGQAIPVQFLYTLVFEAPPE